MSHCNCDETFEKDSSRNGMRSRRRSPTVVSTSTACHRVGDVGFRLSPASSIPVGSRFTYFLGGCTNRLATMGRMHSKGYA